MGLSMHLIQSMHYQRESPVTQAIALPVFSGWKRINLWRLAGLCAAAIQHLSYSTFSDACGQEINGTMERKDTKTRPGAVHQSTHCSYHFAYVVGCVDAGLPKLKLVFFFSILVLPPPNFCVALLALVLPQLFAEAPRYTCLPHTLDISKVHAQAP